MFRIFIAASMAVPLLGQEKSPPSIVGEIKTSVESNQPRSRVLLNRPIKNSKVIHDQGRTITIYKVEPPVAQPKKPSKETPSEGARVRPESSVKTRVGYTVSATALSENLTRLEWWSHNDGQKSKNVSWSNIRWQHLQGFNTIEDGERSYTFMLFQSGDSVEGFNKRAEILGLNLAPEYLPTFDQDGSKYSNEDDAEVSEVDNSFLEAIHTLYELKDKELKQAHELREKNREMYRQELALNPPKKEDVVIQFWKRDRSEETPTQKRK